MEANSIEKIKKLSKEKFSVIEVPEKEDYVIVIKEDLVDVETGKTNYELGVGKVMKFPNKISVNGRSYRNSELDMIKEGSVELKMQEINKQDDRHKIMIVKTPKSFYISVDKASWAGNFKTLDDLATVIAEYDPSSSGFSLF